MCMLCAYIFKSLCGMGKNTATRTFALNRALFYEALETIAISLLSFKGDQKAFIQSDVSRKRTGIFI